MSLVERARAATGMTLRDFAEALGTTHSVVARWKRGARPSGPTRVLLRLLADHPIEVLRLMGYEVIVEEVEVAAPISTEIPLEHGADSAPKFEDVDSSTGEQLTSTNSAEEPSFDDEEIRAWGYSGPQE